MCAFQDNRIAIYTASDPVDQEASVDDKCYRKLAAGRCMSDPIRSVSFPTSTQKQYHGTPLT